jgi:hypothetical protein
MTERVESLWQWWPFVAYIACIVGANWAVATFGPVPETTTFLCISANANARFG